MSVIDTANHNVVAYVSGVTKAFTGQRLATVCYKTITDKSNALYGVKRENKAVSLPVIGDAEITTNIAVLAPHVRNMLEVAQDKILREMLDSDSKLASVSTEAVSLAAIVEYLDNSNESGRLTKETVAAWFDSTVADTLMLALAEKLGVSDTPSDAESKKIEAIAIEFRAKIAALAGGKTSYSVPVATQLVKCLALVPSDVMASKFTGRLQRMIAENAVSNIADAL